MYANLRTLNIVYNNNDTSINPKNFVRNFCLLKFDAKCKQIFVTSIIDIF